MDAHALDEEWQTELRIVCEKIATGKKKQQNEEVRFFNILAKVLKDPFRLKQETWAAVLSSLTILKMEFEKEESTVAMLERVQSFAEAFLMMANEPLDGTTLDAKQIIEVAGDGSCFYQALHYSLMWIMDSLPYDSEDGDASLHKMKMAILDSIFEGDRGFKSSEVEQKVKDAWEYHGGGTLPTKKDAMNLMGIHTHQKKSNSNVQAADLVMELASIAFNVQILVYSTTIGAKNLQKQSTKRGRGGVVRENPVQEAVQLFLTFASGCKGAMDLHEDTSDLKAYYTGQKVVTLQFHATYNVIGHYNVLSRFPLLQNMSEDGSGKAGEVVLPTRLQAVLFQGSVVTDMHMPILKMCFRCNKLMLDGC
jgi:hypothetical protein